MNVSASGYWTLVEAFLAGRTSPNTRAAYRRDLFVLADALGVKQPEQPPRAVFGVEDDATAHQAARDLAAIGPQWWQSWRDGLPGTAASRRRRVAGVRAFCRWWSTMFALHNPVQDLSPPGGVADAKRQLGREVVALDQAQIRAMCEAAAHTGGPEGACRHALIETLYGMGLRASEAASLNISDLHLDDPDDPFVVVHGKGSRQRAVAVPTVARNVLLAYLRVGRPELRARDVKPRSDQTRHRDADAVFVTTRGRRIGRTSVWREVQAVAERAGLVADGQRVFPHALRHSCGTHLIQAGVDIRYVQAHLGHASPVTTEIYTHVTAAHLREDFDRAHPRSRRAG
jgi:site-specific recombinase XerD